MPPRPLQREVSRSSTNSPAFPSTPVRPRAAFPSTPIRGGLRETSGTGLTPQSVSVHQVKRRRNNSPIAAFRDVSRAIQERPNRRAIPGQLGFVLGVASRPASDGESDESEVDAEGGDPQIPPSPTIEDDGGTAHDPLKEQRQHAYRMKREATTTRWLSDVLPKLRAPYMRLMQESNNLRDRPKRSEPRRGTCTCNGARKCELSILVLRMSDVSRVVVNACQCRPAAEQLVEVGLFPCAPYRPTLAVDMNVLDFARLLFLHISPNVTAWCKATEAFLLARSHKLNYSDTLRKRFGYALLWYTQLHDNVNKFVDASLEAARNDLNMRRAAPSAAPAALDTDSDTDDGPSPPPTPTPAHDARRRSPLPSPPRLPGRGRKRHAATSSDDTERPHHAPLIAPSQYLRSRCPACFVGGQRLNDRDSNAPDVLVALDACFSQKHNKQTRDPAFHHPDDIMLSEAALASAEARVHTLRPPKEKDQRRRTNFNAQAAGIQVPPEALQNCEESFKAAQSSIAKANTGSHDVTAVMALLCRHDIPLFWANMTTPGEQQFYVVALVDALMRELPPNWVVGLLYDIACQIHLSATKYGLFGGYLDRLRFAVSVFHAFGHDWPCQLVYHPRKCIGFGLTDGEGCERFWYSISKLIPYLRVAGFHLQKYTLNAQFAFATKDAISALASWIGRKARILENKRREALMLLDEAGDVAKDENFIREQWRAQVKEQTRPSPKQGKDLGHRELSKALELHEELERAAAEEAELREEAPEGLEEQAELRAAEAAHLAAKAKYERKLAQLGVPARAQLKKLVGNKLLHRRANALVLLRRVQTGIMKRKLEVERVVRSHRNKNGENRLRKHIKTAAERRKGTVKSLVSKYNRACNDLAKLIKAQRSRKGRCPVRPLKLLPKAGLWDLDIDNPCWDDLRFDAAEDSAPPWMSDDNVRKAIRGRLLLDRCAEEEMRLAHERAGLERWFEEEWRVSQSAIARGIRVPDAPALIHQLQHRRRGLLRLAIQWQGHRIRIRGPSPDELTAASRDWAAASCDQPLRFTRADPFDDGVDSDDEGPGVGGDVEDEVDEDGDLLDALEDAAGALYDRNGGGLSRSPSPTSSRNSEDCDSAQGGMESGGSSGIGEEQSEAEEEDDG